METAILIDILVQLAALEEERELFSVGGRAAEHPAALPEIDREIQRLTALVPDPTRRRLLRFRERGKRAVLFAREDACEGCGAVLPPADALGVRRGSRVVRCLQCGSFLVHRPWR